MPDNLIETENNDLTYQVYLDERKLLIQAEAEQARSFDKSILTLAAGAFGLSIAFVKQLAPTVKVGSLSILVFAWIFFASSILITLTGYLLSQWALSKQRDILEAIYFSGSSKPKSTPRNKLTSWVMVSSILSIITFMSGVILLAIFSVLNLNT